MYKIQKGILPVTLLIVGMITILYSMIVLFLFSAKLIFLGKFELPSDFEQQISFYLPAIPLLVLGLYLTTVFPWIRLSQEGLRYRGLFFNGTVRWAEFNNIVELKNGIILLSISRKGFFPFRGLIFQRFTGILLRYEYPAILLAPGLEQREQVLAEIMAKSPVKEVRKVRDPYS